MKFMFGLMLAGTAWARPPKPPEPPTWLGPATMAVAGVQAESALVRARLAAPPGTASLVVQVRSLEAEQPLGSFNLPLGEPLRLRGLPAGTWAVEAAAIQAGGQSRWSDPLVIEVQPLGDGVLTVLAGMDPGLPPGDPCNTADGKAFWRPAAGDHTVACGETAVKVQVVAGTVDWESPSVLPRGQAVKIKLKLAGGPLPPVLDLVLGGRAWPLRVAPQGLEAEVVVPAGIDRGELRDPDVPDGPPVAVVNLPAGPKGAGK